MNEMDVLEDLMVIRMMMRNGRRSGNHELFKTRDAFGFYCTGVNVVIEKNPELFVKSTRLTHEQFKAMLNLVEPWLQKHSHRKPIEPDQRLYITLHFLAHGCALHVISMKFRIGLETVRSIILETCNVLWEVLSTQYVSPPNDAEWNTISDVFFRATNLPHCLGALDGKHIRINCPPKSGSQYYNYKRFNSIVLLAVCDSNYIFTFVDVGAYGSQSDGGVLRNSSFGKLMLEKKLNTPPPTNLPNSNMIFPYFFVADAAFPLKENIMRPYSKVSDQSKEVFNRKLSSARIRIEIAFGILTARWRVLRTCISFSPKNAKKVVLATIILHNFLRLHSTNSSVSEECDSCSLGSVNRIDTLTPNTSTQLALNLKNELCQYLNSI